MRAHAWGRWRRGSGAALLALVLGAAGVPAAQAADVSATPSASWSPWKACPNGAQGNCAQVRTIAQTSNGVTFLGGDFTELRSGTQRKPIQNLAALDGAGNPVESFTGHAFNGTVFSLSTDGTFVYAGGIFTKVDGAGALRVAKFDVATGARKWFKSGVNGPVWATELANNRLYIGGKFTAVQGTARNNAAALDPATGARDNTWNPDVQLIAGDTKPNDAAHNNLPVRDIVASPAGDRVYIAGDLDLLGGSPRPAIAAVSPVSGAADTTFAPPPEISTGFQGMQVALADSSNGRTPGVILAAGGLTNRAFRLNLDGSIAWVVNGNGDFQAAAVGTDTVYLGGHYTCVSVKSCYDTDTTDDVQRMHVAAFPYDSAGNPAADPTWAPQLGPTWNPYFYGVWTLEKYGARLHAGGVFNTVKVDGKTYPQPKIARFGA